MGITWDLNGIHGTCWDFVWDIVGHFGIEIKKRTNDAWENGEQKPMGFGMGLHWV